MTRFSQLPACCGELGRPHQALMMKMKVIVFASIPPPPARSTLHGNDSRSAILANLFSESILLRHVMTDTATDQRRMRIAFTANLAMFVTGLIGWYLADSTALLADALDMLADASAYVIAWLAITRSNAFQRHAAHWSGALLIFLGVGVLVEAGNRFLHGGDPQGWLMLAFSVLSLIVNGSVLNVLSAYRHSSEVHLKATWTDTRADVIVNISVLLSGLLIALTGYRQIDWIVGIGIGLYVIREGIEIWQEDDDDDN